MKISIIVPIYNVEAYLEKCLDSILCQTFSDYELILVDDGSTDSSGRIADEYARKDERITVIHKLNGGLSDARNYGIDASRGEYLCFIDSDDWIEPDYLEVLYDVITRNDADMAICGFMRNTGDDRIIQPESPSEIIEDGITAIDHMYGPLYAEYVVAWNKLYKRRLFDMLRYPVGMIHEDEAVYADLFCGASKVVRTERILYNYRSNNAGSIMSTQYSLKHLDILKAMEMRMDKYREKGLIEYYEKDSFKYLYKILINIVEIRKTGEDHGDVIRELKGKYWDKYTESLGFDWTLRRKLGMAFFGLFPRAYMLRYKVK